MKRFYIFLAIIQFCSVLFARANADSCKVWQLLCKRRYNEIVYPATHNGHAYKKSDVAHQDLSLKEQFEQGIRATKLHVWYDIDGNGNVVPFVCQGIDKKILYDPPLDKALEHVPFLFRPFARTCLEKADAFKQIVFDAFNHAYGKDNTSGAVPFRHCILDPARQPLQQALADVEGFLKGNPQQILTLIIEDHTGNAQALADDFKKAGLAQYAHIQYVDKAWPTLNQMISSGKRLVIFVYGESDAAYKNFPWMHYLWDYAWDTKHDFKEINQFKDCSYDSVPYRGKQAFEQRNKQPKNKIFIVHHFITELIGGSKPNAIKVNRKNVLRNRLKRLQEETGHLPNFVQVDFFEYPAGDLFCVVNELNGV